MEKEEVRDDRGGILTPPCTGERRRGGRGNNDKLSVDKGEVLNWYSNALVELKHCKTT
jgi:hypothetical protein